ncbi:DUF5691 domain-containing protein [Flavilitoribacter nigricans]|uniref:Uncharacterized protein n=1 Tax=Flavilitoribacter nigricans (strain ATCC 23147 / DSM 23189 / NBRC 102662 / NCIMB 1420 / SS-2) TaxID=1122177 RepID=A0A2D0N517_FLAN2|nr:DUF5691 domain-containing protein [Flavilitoribacter nigricans]PHN03595.1 hypothetical protein CRP01_25375 [Flavilitoribacter nigricans DSM 23189 = NBRC 102662]
MQLWEKILQLALLGSERSHLEPVVEENLRQYRVDPEDPLPQVILSGAAALHQVRRLRMPTSAYTDPLPEPSADETAYEELPSLSLQHLNQILSGRFRPALPEFVRLLVDHRLLLPAEFLPELLSDCLTDAALWQDVQPLLGDRADWLIEQHPQWRILKPRGLPERWPEAGHEERRLILGYLREREPKGALDLLVADWEQTPYRKKLDYLEILTTGLGSEDEVFLEQARTDSRKEVRMKAADLLAMIPDSQLIRRIFNELEPVFTLDKARNRLDIAMPKEVSEATAADGIQPGVRKGKRGGLKADWLFQCVSRIPARHWMERFGWTKEELIRYFDTTGRGDLLLAALGSAGLRFRDEELITDLIRYLAFKNGVVPEDLDWQALTRRIPVGDFQDMVETFLRQQPGLLEEKHLITRMLELGKQPWTESMSRQIIHGLKQWMAESKTFLWNLWHYKRLLETAGYCSPVALLDELAADWPMQSPVWNQWAPDVERMLRIMRFRKEMRTPLGELR